MNVTDIKIYKHIWTVVTIIRRKFGINGNAGILFLSWRIYTFNVNKEKKTQNKNTEQNRIKTSFQTKKKNAFSVSDNIFVVFA